MKASLTFLVAAVALLLPAPSPVFAGPADAGSGVVVADFEDGKLGPWGVDEKEKKQPSRVPEVLEIVKDGGAAVLHFRGGGLHNRVYYQGRQFKDFSLEVRVKKTSGSYAGVVVRDHWRVYFQMKGYLCLNCDLKEWEGKGELFKSSEAFTGYHTLRVACAGPLLHVYVDGRPIFQYRITPGEGRVGLYTHGRGEAYYDDLRIDPRVDPVQYLAVEPQAAEQGLVFSPKENVRLCFRVSKYSDGPQQVAVAAAVKTWAGQIVKQPPPREVTAAPGQDATAEFDMGPLAAGFYRIDLGASCSGKQVCEKSDLPLTVQERGTGQFKPPTIPLAAYYKYYSPKSPLYVNTYAHAAARSLRDHHFNAVVADPSFTREVIDIFQGYGIATIARSGQFIDHPAVIATLLADEPKPDEIDQLKEEYRKLRQTAAKPITTCMVGEGMGLRGPGDPVRIWERLEPDLRCFRWYGVKKSFYGILHEVTYKQILPLSSVLRIAETSSSTPYWFVAPSLGKSDHEAYYYAPTPAEIRGMMHLAMAYGADGILFFAFQSHAQWPCLVDQQSLEPIDEKYAAAAEAAARIEAHADLITSLEHAGLDVRCPSPVVDAVPRKSTRDDRLYVYAVNKDTRNPVSTRLLLWAEVWHLTSVKDVYSGTDLKVTRDEEGYWSVPLTLAPGEGQLLRTDAALAKPKQ